MKKFNNRMAAILAACGIVLLAGAPACAADASPWVEDNYSAIRLIAGANQPAPKVCAPASKSNCSRRGIPIGAIPATPASPCFIFAGSDNLATVKVLYPAPHAYTDEVGTTIGYKGNVILPLRVFPRQKDKPVTLRAKVDYAVCDRLCVPVEAKLELTLLPNGGADNPALVAAEARVPKPVSAAEAGLTAKRANDDKLKPLVFVDLAAPTGQPVELFVEGPTPEWALPIPKPAQAPRRACAFRLRARWAAAGRRSQGRVRTHIHDVQGDRAIEVDPSRLIRRRAILHSIEIRRGHP